MNRAKAKRLIKEKARDIVANHWDDKTTIFFGPIEQGNNCLFANYILHPDESVKAISVSYDSDKSTL